MELLGMGAVGAFDVAVELRGAGREDDKPAYTVVPNPDTASHQMRGDLRAFYQKALAGLQP